MSDPQDKDPGQNEVSGEPAAQPSADKPAEGRRSGRVAFDARGNPTWEWQLQTGVYSRDISTQKLKKLDLGDLSIAESAIHKRPPGLDESGGSASPAPAGSTGGGSNPYDNSSRPNQGADPYDSARALARKVNSDAGGKPVWASPPRSSRPAPVRKQSALNRLEQWFRDKRRPKDDDDYE
jgi:hypothetical protein